MNDKVHLKNHSTRVWPGLVWALVMALCGVVALPAHAAEPTAQPLLRLETGMHTAIIKRIATDRDGRWAVTASEDKTARIWDVATGRLAGVLRPPQDAGDEGKLYAVAMSPDGATVAVGGWTKAGSETGHTIYLFDRTTQQLRRRISGLPNVIPHLAWSPDGRWLAAGLGGANGVRIFDAGNGAEVGRDADFKGSSYSVEFSPSGSPGGLRLLSTSEDGQVRLHAVAPSGALSLLRAVRPNGGKDPFAARFSPDGRRVAVGYDDTRVVQVLDAADLNEIARPDVTGVGNGDLSKVAWSADGRSLAAAGRWNVNGKRPMRRWSVVDGRPVGAGVGDVPLTDNTVTNLVALPARAGGGWLFAGGDPTWGVLGADGRVLRRQDPVLADLRAQYSEFQVSSDGLRLRFGFQVWGKDAHVVDIGQRTIQSATAPTDLALAPPRTEAPRLTVDWKETTTPTLNGQPLKLNPYEGSRSLAITPDGQRFVLGTEWWLRCFDREGKPLWTQPVPSIAWAVNISADGRWVVAGYGDGTIRWHRMEDGQEVLAFFPHANRQDWVLWTPEGFYAASPGAEGLIGYHINHGKDREGEFISAAQLRDHFYNPALVSARLGANGDQLMADAVAKLGDVQTLLANARNVPPAIELLTPAQVEGETEVTVTLRLVDRGGGVGALKFYVDGVPVEGRQTGVAGGQTVTRTFSLAPGTHQIASAATSRGGVESPRQVVNAVFTGAKQATTLHILAVGVETYHDPALQLKNSVHDAEKVAEELAVRAKPLFARISPPRVLKNKQATLAGIRQAFTDMRAQMKPDDTLVIFLAGHGQAQVGQYAFLPWDYQKGASGALGEGLNEARLFQMLDQSPSKTLLLIDSCEAGGMVELLEGSYERIGTLKKRAVIGASRKGELAREGFEGHGVFTAALLQALSKAGDGSDELTVPGLYDEVKKGVTRISTRMPGGYRQTVKGFLGTADFPVARR
jgi:WD40 repeat protein